MKEGGQLELLALLSRVLGINWKEAEQRKLRLRLAYMDPLQISFLSDRPITLLSTKAGPAAFYL